MKQLVLKALNSGYKHIDCAAIYQNEKQVGEAFSEYFATHDRKGVFVTGKLWNTDHSPANVRNACLKSLSDL